MVFMLHPRSILRKPTHLLLTACLVLGAHPYCAPAISAELPEIGDPSGGLLTPIQEQRLGQAFMRSIRKHMSVVRDPLMSEYMQALGANLVSSSPSVGQPFHFFLIDNPEVNAFAGPAGHIGIHTGLVLTTESESELASVVAHEIAHVSQKHLMRTFDAANRMSLPMAALLLAAIVAGGQSNSDIGAAAATAIQAGFMQYQINFTRANEEEADRVGVEILAKSDFDPRAMPVFFERMGRASRFQGSELPEFLRTHPVTTTRIADSRGRAESYPYRQYPGDIRYHLLRATLREAQFSDPKEAVRFFRDTLADGRYLSEAGQRYGYALALMRAREFTQARTELEKLLHEDPHQIAYLVSRARLMLGAEKPESAVSDLKTALELYPGNYPLSLTYAEVLMHVGQPQAARQILEDQVYSRPGDAELYKLLSQATGAAGDIAQAHEYQAEYHYQSGELEPAVQQLEIAFRAEGVTLFQSTRIAARLKEIRQELADLKQQE